jgi:hypothetical protein
MPSDLAAALGRPAERHRFRAIDKFILGALLLVLVMLIVNFQQNRHAGQRDAKIRQTQADGIIRGYINRAVACDLQKGLGLHESKGCADPAIQSYRDGATAASSSTGATQTRLTRAALCDFLRVVDRVEWNSAVIIPDSCLAP